jgi:hypothetical protein
MLSVWIEKDLTGIPRTVLHHLVQMSSHHGYAATYAFQSNIIKKGGKKRTEIWFHGRQDLPNCQKHCQRTIEKTRLKIIVIAKHLRDARYLIIIRYSYKRFLKHAY